MVVSVLINVLPSGVSSMCYKRLPLDVSSGVTGSTPAPKVMSCESFHQRFSGFPVSACRVACGSPSTPISGLVLQHKADKTLNTGTGANKAANFLFCLGMAFILKKKSCLMKSGEGATVTSLLLMKLPRT